MLPFSFVFFLPWPSRSSAVLFRAGPRALNRHWGRGLPAPSLRIVVRSSQQTPLRWQQTQHWQPRAEPHSLQVVPDFHAGTSENALSLIGPSPPSCLSRPWACDFEDNLAEYHRCRKAKKPKADAARVSSARALAGENGDRDRKREGGKNGDRDRKREGGENGDRDRKREGGENGDRDRKGGDRAQQQAAGRAADVEDKRKARQEGGQSSGRARGAAARRRRGQDDAAVISLTSNIRGRASVRDRIITAQGLTVRRAIEMNIYTTRSLKRDETAGYIQLVHATGEGDPDTFVRDAEDDALDSAGFQMDMDTYVGNPIDDFSD